MKRSNRFVALLLSALLVLQPVTSMAAGATDGTVDQDPGTVVDYGDMGKLWKRVSEPNDDGSYTINIGARGHSDYEKMQDPVNIIMVLDNSNSMYDAKTINSHNGTPTSRMDVLKRALVGQGGFFDTLNANAVDPDGDKLNIAMVPFSSEVQDGQIHKMKNPLYYYSKGQSGYKNNEEFLDIQFPNYYIPMTHASDFTNGGQGVTTINSFKKQVSSTDYWDMKNTVYYGSTNLDSGLERASAELAKVTNNGRKIVVVISDGAPTVAKKITNFAAGEFEPADVDGNPVNVTGGYLYSGFDDTDARTVKLQGGVHWQGDYYTTADGVAINNNGQSSVVRANKLREQGIEFYAVGVALADDVKAHNTRQDVIDTLKGVADSDIYDEQTNSGGRVFLSEDADSLAKHLDKISSHLSGTPTIYKANFSDPMGPNVEFKGNSVDDVVVTASSDEVKDAVKANLTYDAATNSLNIPELTLGEDQWFNLEYKVAPKLGPDFPYSQKVPTNGEAKIHWTKTQDGAVVEEGDLVFPSPTIEVQPTPKATPSETTGFQGVPQESVIVLNSDGDTDDTESLNFLPETKIATGQIDPATVTLLDNDSNPTDQPVEVRDDAGKLVGTYTLNGLTITFTPEKDFTGTAPAVKVRAANKAGKTVETTYTPHVVGVDPTANPARTKGYQGEEQEAPIIFDADDNAKSVNFNRGRDIPQGQINRDSVELLNPEGNPVDSYPVEVAGRKIGEYILDKANSTIIFRPTPEFTGDVAVPPATLRAADNNGTTVTTTYTPEVESVTPQALPSETTNFQGVVQESDIKFNEKDASRKTLNFLPGVEGVESAQINPATVTLLNDQGQPADSVDVSKDGAVVGTYTLNAEKNKVIFTPVNTFTGEAPAVEVQAQDNNGTPVKTTYTPTVIGVGITPFPAATKNFQGVEQVAPVVFNQQTPDPSQVTFNPNQDVEPAQIDPASIVILDDQGQPAPQVPAMKNGVQVGVFTTRTGADGQTSIVFTPEPTFVGKAPSVQVRATNKVGTHAVTTYTPTVVGVVPDAAEAQTENWQGETQTAPIVFNAKDDKADTVNFFGTETIPQAEIDPATVELLDANGDPATGPVDVFENGVKVGSYSLNAAKDAVVFTPEPDFTGVAPAVELRAADKNGTYAKTRYVPTVKPVAPEAVPSETEGPQGEAQTSLVVIGPDDKNDTVNFTDGNEIPNADIDPDSITLLDAAGNPTAGPVDVFKAKVKVGTYTFDPATKVITFTPELDFVGTAPAVGVQAANKLGTTVKTTYTPTVTPVVPVAEPSTTTGSQGEPQTSTVVVGEDTDGSTVNFIGGEDKAAIDPATITLLDENGNPTTNPIPAEDADGNIVGTYSFDPATKVITFTPNNDFVGTPEPARLEAANELGQTVETTYTPTVTPVDLTPAPSETTGLQGEVQTSKVVLGDDTNDATVNFIGGANKAEVDPASITLLDGEGNPTTDPVVVKDAEGKTVGTYTYDAATQTITFTPEPDFVGTAPAVGVQASNKLGMSVKTTYTPTVTPVDLTPAPSETTGPQGEVQTSKVVLSEDTNDATVNFIGGADKAEIDPATITLLDGEGNPTTDPVVVKDAEGKTVGTYTYDAATQTITFTPEPDFVGTAPAVGVQASNKLGMSVKTTYTPTVTPVEPTAKPVETEGKKGQTQSATLEFTPGVPGVPMDDTIPAVIVDAEGNPLPGVVEMDGNQYYMCYGVGSYTVDPMGKVTFTPDPDYTGTAIGIYVMRKDMNGTPAIAKYTPTVVADAEPGTPDTSTPDTGKPDTGKPDTGKPDTGKPDTGKPDTGKPDTGKPDTGKPDTGTPDTVKPDTGKPDTVKPEPTKPEPETTTKVVKTKVKHVVPATYDTTFTAYAVGALVIGVAVLVANKIMKSRKDD